MFTDILWRFLILETFVLGALCSSNCSYDHPQKQFCTSEFVLEVRFHDETYAPPRYTYRTEIIKVLKGNVKLLNIKDERYVNVVTNGYLHFFVGRKHIIFGRNENGSIYTDYCYRSMPFETPTHIFRIFLELFYKYDCDCPDEGLADLQCQWFSYVVENRNHNCNWVKPENVILCHKGVLEYGSVFYPFYRRTLKDE